MSATYADKSGTQRHISFFREWLESRARPLGKRDDAHEYLIDQANLRGFVGAFSSRDDLGTLDCDLGLEELVVGLVQPHAPADLRALKLVVRILQSGRLDAERLHLLARRERALPTLAWIVDLVPDEERNAPIIELLELIRAHPPRDTRRPEIRYSSSRLVRPRKHHESS